MHQSKAVLFSFLLAASLLSCGKREDVPASAEVAAEIKNDVPYGTDPAQRIDIHLPARRSTAVTKVIFLIHGGSWTGGDKSDFHALLPLLQDQFKGYAFVNVNYRLASMGGNFFPTQENDIKAAVQFVYDKSSEYALSRDFVMMGYSAGGHLALLQALKYNTPVKAKAVISYYGPTDMAALYNNAATPNLKAGIAQLLGGTPSTAPGNYAQSSPITYAANTSPPTIIFQGGQDLLVTPLQSASLFSKLSSLGGPVEYHFYPTEGHGFGMTNTRDSWAKAVLFLQRYVN